MLFLAIFVPVVTIVFAISALVCCILYLKNYSDGPYILGIVFCAFFIFGLIVSPVVIFKNYEYQQEYTKCIATIVSLERDDVVDGKFFLGSGAINDRQYYFYYQKLGENTYKLGKLECSEVYIVETDQYEPSVYEIKEKNNWKYYNIYVPFGTMVVSYSV